jgi:hypothetical protein
MQMMPNPRPFDGYVEKPVRVSSTALIHFQRNRYSVPTDCAHRVMSLRIYPAELRLVADGRRSPGMNAASSGTRPITTSRHYIGVIERKPGALRNGAPFAEMPEPLAGLAAASAQTDGRRPGDGRRAGAIPRTAWTPCWWPPSWPSNPVGPAASMC